MATQTCNVCGTQHDPASSQTYDDDDQACCVWDTTNNCGELIEKDACCVIGNPSQTGKFDFEFCSGQCGVGDLKSPAGPCCGITRITSAQQCCPGDIVMPNGQPCPQITGDPHVAPFCGDPYDL